MRHIAIISLICALGLTACGNTTAPSASRVADRLSTRSEPPQETVRWLTRRGYKRVRPTGYGGGMFPRTGACYQRKKGTRLGGQPIVRVCFAAGRYPVVLEQHTLDHYWIERYPNDRSNYKGPVPHGLGRISKDTLEILEK